MLTEILTKLYRRDLEKLRFEIAAFASERDLWRTVGTMPNSAGNLCLHITGNLQHFIGAVLGNSGYVRDRESEFSARAVPSDKLFAEIDAADSAVSAALERLTADDYAATYSHEVLGAPMRTDFFLVHLSTHLNYHLGQINYLRRALAEDGAQR